ncbi:hypothetical protein AR457_27515 [Streptomyces agglomeratus]|uniref:Cytochrome n=1 Tax=Streptomyces agglomeratus TaxID=285458 RepID=A0A1E5PDN9_9ACTN|nr:hypothetical protein [Streptomyces agglomeratus]OEJ27652.1 hypothetical protein AS594_27385 [Streptomyces agglomeratus]OEJ38287.1 hypothetical protein BGK70_09140 [Streptomyces agglomeratus]OEJ47328.1 hypothetical protein AR457_27515 [Streptomyces agglomeratus]OEJ50815.1 hypothetical protein BGK72_08625 [Streptomyces agglomeratus]OEJ58178.1 hypothetical protein BGM19_09490 [Streptomyces agglomeratus]
MTTSTPDARAVLRDPRFLVPRAPSGGAPGTMRWLRASVARFSNGAAHTRRRALAEGELARLDPAALREAARVLTRTAAPDAAPYVPVAVLGAALGARGEVVAATRAVAAAYQPGAAPELTARADQGVRTLAGLLPDGGPESVANRIGLLVQTCDATAALIVNALARAAERRTGLPVDDLVADTLRLAPPVRRTRRVAAAGAALDGRPVPKGSDVPVDLASADAPFGHGIRPCPGSRHALALACGVLDVLLEDNRS